jgi:hypothetical protein
MHIDLNPYITLISHTELAAIYYKYNIIIHSNLLYEIDNTVYIDKDVKYSQLDVLSDIIKIDIKNVDEVNNLLSTNKDIDSLICYGSFDHVYNGKKLCTDCYINVINSPNLTHLCIHLYNDIPDCLKHLQNLEYLNITNMLDDNNDDSDGFIDLYIPPSVKYLHCDQNIIFDDENYKSLLIIDTDYSNLKPSMINLTHLSTNIYKNMSYDFSIYKNLVYLSILCGVDVYRNIIYPESLKSLHITNNVLDCTIDLKNMPNLSYLNINTTHGLSVINYENIPLNIVELNGNIIIDLDLIPTLHTISIANSLRKYTIVNVKNLYTDYDCLNNYSNIEHLLLSEYDPNFNMILNKCSNLKLLCTDIDIDSNITTIPLCYKSYYNN